MRVGGVLRWTDWIDGVVMHVAEDAAATRLEKRCKTRGKELDAACTWVVASFAVVNFVLCLVRPQGGPLAVQQAQ